MNSTVCLKQSLREAATTGIYKSLDGKRWELAFQTDEEDVRCLCMFNGYPYLGL